MEVKHTVEMHAIYTYEIDDEDLSGYMSDDVPDPKKLTIDEVVEIDRLTLEDTGYCFEELGILDEKRVTFKVVADGPKIRYCNYDGCVHQFSGPHGLSYHQSTGVVNTP